MGDAVAEELARLRENGGLDLVAVDLEIPLAQQVECPGAVVVGRSDFQQGSDQCLRGQRDALGMDGAHISRCGGAPGQL